MPIGNILDIDDAERLLQEGNADFAAMGRALIADPYLLQKETTGKSDKVNGCIQCKKCLSTPKMICSVNESL